MAPVVHIGLPKTGSTFLQRKVFPLIPNANYYSSCDRSLPDAFGWVYRINGPWLVNYISRKTRRDKIEDIFHKERRQLMRNLPGYQEQFRSLPHEMSLISSEGFVGCSPDPLLNADLCAKLLKIQHPNAKIILLLRRQDTWCESIYRQLVFVEDRFRRFISFKEFFDLDENRSGRVPVSMLAWDQLAKIYYRVFGASNVCVFPYELLRDDPAAFIQSLCDFLEIETPKYIDFKAKENARPVDGVYSRGTLASRFRRILGGVRYGDRRTFFELDGFLRDVRTRFKYEGQHYQMPRHEELVEILRKCQASNRRLSRVCGIDFSKYGYH